MRLIDADKLKEAIEEEKKDNDYMCRLCLESIKEIIDEQPTAFDVDKVVEQIESIKEKEYRACTDAQCGFCDYSNDCWDGEMCDKLALDKAIGLVKEGGVE
nr:MAG TPA: Protein of unknown function (DUF2800) [Caudoviricetes sp.]